MISQGTIARKFCTKLRVSFPMEDPEEWLESINTSQVDYGIQGRERPSQQTSLSEFINKAHVLFSGHRSDHL